MAGVLIGILLTFGAIGGVLLVACVVALAKSADTHK